MAAQVKTDARFAIIPEWLLDLENISHAAIRLYCILDRYADADGHAFPSRKALAERMGVKSADTVDRALKELVAAHAVTITRRYDAAGDPTSNLYIVHRYPPEGVAARMRPPTPDDAATGPQGSGDGSRTDAALNENHLNQNPLPPTTTPAEQPDDDPASSLPTSTDQPPTPGPSPCGRAHSDRQPCRACGTNPKALAQQHRRQVEAERRAAEQKRLTEERARAEQLRVAGRSPQVDQLVEQTRKQLAGSRR